MSASVLTTARHYLDLTKPRLLPLVLFTGLPVFGMAAGGWPPLRLRARSCCFGITLAAASANTLNAYIERDKDALMERTRTRPLPAGRIAPRAALLFGLAARRRLDRAALRGSGLPAASLGVASILFYVFVYTIWLKPRSIWNAVIGGAAGAAAPLIADAAVNGSDRRRGPVALRDRVLLAAAARLGDRALSQGRLRGGRHPDAAVGDRRRADAPARGGVHGRARARDRRAVFLRARRPDLLLRRELGRRLVPLPLGPALPRADRRGRAGRVPGLARLPVRGLRGDARRPDGRALSSPSPDRPGRRAHLVDEDLGLLEGREVSPLRRARCGGRASRSGPRTSASTP